MLTRRSLAAGLVAALALGGATLGAQPPDRTPGARVRALADPRIDLGLRGIALSDSQREQVRAILESHRAALAEARQTLRDARRAFEDAAHAQPIDEALVRERSAALATAMANEAILLATVRAEVHGILTAEQLQQLQERRQQLEQRRQERQQRLQQRLQQRRPGA